MKPTPPDAAGPVSSPSRAAGTTPCEPAIDEAFAQAVAHERSGRLDLAEESYRRIVARAPGHVESLHNLGAVLRRLGDMRGAEALFREVLRVRPDSCMTIYQLTHTRRYDAAGDADARRIEKLLDGGRLTDRDAVFLHFSLGKIYADCGEFEPAFDSYRRGNELLRKRSRFDPASFERYVDRIIGTFTPQLIESLGSFSDPSELPVFVVGMPRSGTTLLEQILSAHPLVHGAGELTFVDQAIGNLRARGNLKQDYPELARCLKGEVLAAEAKNYERFVRSLMEKDAVRFVDKMPYNFKHVGLIALLFSRARVVHCRREPRDVCLSNYFQLYVARHEHTYSLPDLGRYHRAYERLMNHWRCVIDPARLYEIRYEDLVSDTEAGARGLVRFLGLAWDERCLRPHESERAVHTASTWQVRQPVYSSSVGRWKSYEKFLGPLEVALRGG